MMTKTELLTAIQNGWDRLHEYLATLSEEQLIRLTDTAGWTVKDHVIHLAIWEDGANAMLLRQSRREQMDIDEAVWKRWNFDEINAVIQSRYRDMSFTEVLQTFRAIHQRLLSLIEAMSEEDVSRPVSYYDVRFGGPEPVAEQLLVDTVGHYEEHMPWIAAIVSRHSAG